MRTIAWIAPIFAFAFASPSLAADRVGIAPISAAESSIASELTAEIAAGLTQSGFTVLKGRRLEKATKVAPEGIASRCQGRKKCVARLLKKNRLERLVVVQAAREGAQVAVSIRVFSFNGAPGGQASLRYGSRGDLPAALGTVWKKLFGVPAPSAFAPATEAPTGDVAADDGLALIPLEPLPSPEPAPEVSPTELELELTPPGDSDAPGPALDAAPVAPPDPRGLRTRWKMWTAVGVATVGLAAGGYAFLLDQDSDSESERINGDPSISQVDAIAAEDDIDRDELIATTLAVTSGALIGLAAYLIWDDLDDEPSVQLNVAPAGAGVTVRF